MKFNIGIYLFACIICFASCDFKRKTDDKNDTVIVEETFHISPSKITLFMEKDILRICPLTAAEFANEMKRQSEFMRCASYDNTAYKAFIELETLLKVAKGNSSQYSPNTSEYAQDTIELMVGGKPISLVAKSDILNRDNMPVNCVILYDYDYDAEIPMDTICLLTTSSNGIIRLNSHLVQVDSITFCQARNIIWDIKDFHQGNPNHKEQDHVHFNDGAALNKDGSWKHGYRKLTNAEKEYLTNEGWNISPD